MRILHVIPSFDLGGGGPPRICLRLAAGAAAGGHAVTVLAYDFTTDAARSAFDDDRRAVPGAHRVTFTFVPPPGRAERVLATRGRRALVGMIGDFDVVHTHDVWNGISRAAVAVAAAKGVPFVVLPNGMFDPWSMSQRGLKKRAVLAVGYRRVLNRAAFFHAGNVDEANGIRGVGITTPPIEIVPNGVYREEFDPLPPAGRFRAAHPELDGKPFVLFLSRLHYKKGLDYLAAAFAMVAAKHPDARLVVAGPDDGAADGFRAAVATAGLTSRVHVVGPIYGPARFEALVDAACFCLPSRQEGFSVAILEAMACGTPVVVSDACHFPEVAAGGAGAVVPLGAAAVADAIDGMLSDPTAARRQGVAGRAMVFDRYTWPKISDRLLAAYGRAIGRR